MKKARLLMMCIVLLSLAACVIWFLRDASRRVKLPETNNGDKEATFITPPPVPNTISEPADYKTEFSKRVNFWGRVYDEVSARPVGEAQIIFEVIDDPDLGASRDATVYHAISDSNGYFSLLGKKGAFLNVRVSKIGYYELPNRSNAFFAHTQKSVDPVMNWRPFPMSAEEAVTFFLHKKGEPVALVHLEDRRGRVSRDGSPVSINLASGEKVNTDSGDLKVQVWIDDLDMSKGKHYSWRCMLSVPGGGLILRTNDYDFVAPEQNYKTSDEINVSGSQDQQNWNNDVTREYFVKTSQGKFARVKFEMIIGNQGPYYILDVYLNPAGDRNLEFSKELEINNRKR